MNISITLIIVVVTVLISIQAFNRPGMIDQLKHWPYREKRNNEWYRLITSGFVHGSWLHLGINMFVFYEFGQFIEIAFLDFFGETMGRINYVLLYLLTIAAGDMPSYFAYKDQPGYGSIGASGAVSGILFIFILLNPWQTLLLYFIIPAPAILVGVGYLWYSSWASRHSDDNIDHMAHFYGALFGVLFTIALKPDLAVRFVRKLSELPF